MTASILAADALRETCSNLASFAKKNADGDQTGNLVQQLHREIPRILDFIPNIRAMA